MVSIRNSQIQVPKMVTYVIAALQFSLIINSPTIVLAIFFLIFMISPLLLKHYQFKDAFYVHFVGSTLMNYLVWNFPNVV